VIAIQGEGTVHLRPDVAKEHQSEKKLVQTHKVIQESVHMTQEEHENHENHEDNEEHEEHKDQEDHEDHEDHEDQDANEDNENEIDQESVN